MAVGVLIFTGLLTRSGSSSTICNTMMLQPCYLMKWRNTKQQIYPTKTKKKKNNTLKPPIKLN